MRKGNMKQIIILLKYEKTEIELKLFFFQKVRSVQKISDALSLIMYGFCLKLSSYMGAGKTGRYRFLKKHYFYALNYQ